jgi:hypothetical protein
VLSYKSECADDNKQLDFSKKWRPEILTCYTKHPSIAEVERAPLLELFKIIMILLLLVELFKIILKEATSFNKTI